MSEDHKIYTGVDTTGSPPNGPDEIMYNIFDFVYNNGSGRSGVQFVSGNISYSVHNGTSFAANAAAVGVNYFTGSNAYIMLESKNTMPSGYRWQVQLKRVSSTNFSYNFAPRGSWDSSTQTFNSGSFPTTGLINWWTLTSVTGYHMLVSSGDLDTYGASAVPVEYFRFLLRSPTAADGSQMTGLSSMRVGGYIPTDAVNDTNPACIFVGAPSATNTSTYWGRNTSDSTNYNRVPTDTTGASTNLATAGYCRIVGLTEFNSFLNRNGQAVTFPFYIHLVDGSATVGYFGKYDMLQGHSNNQDGMKDGTGNYIFFNNIFFRFTV